MYISWNETMATGANQIDDQHKELIKQLDLLTEAMMMGKGRGEIENILSFLGTYVVMHFMTEEELMQRYQCPVAEQNKLAHAQFIETFGQLQERFKTEGATSALVIDVKRKLNEWLTNHIVQIDTQLSACVKR